MFEPDKKNEENPILFSEKEEEEMTYSIKSNLKFFLGCNTDFENFIENNSIFVDKTLLIKDLIETKAGGDVN